MQNPSLFKIQVKYIILENEDLALVNFILKLMNSVFKSMNSVVKLMNSVSKKRCRMILTPRQRALLWRRRRSRSSSRSLKSHPSSMRYGRSPGSSGRKRPSSTKRSVFQWKNPDFLFWRILISCPGIPTSYWTTFDFIIKKPGESGRESFGWRPNKSPDRIHELNHVRLDFILLKIHSKSTQNLDLIEFTRIYTLLIPSFDVSFTWSILSIWLHVLLNCPFRLSKASGNSSFSLQHSSSLIQSSSFLMQNSSFLIQNSPIPKASAHLRPATADHQWRILH